VPKRKDSMRRKFTLIGVDRQPHTPFVLKLERDERH
jgi:hypothetical protein